MILNTNFNVKVSHFKVFFYMDSTAALSMDNSVINQ